MNKNLILVGGGGFGRELINYAEDTFNAGSGYLFTGFLDDNPSALEVFGYQLPWLGKIFEYNPKPNDEFILAIGKPKDKKNIAEHLKAKGAIFANLIHPTAVIARTARLGEGIIACPHSAISADSHVGNFVCINTFSGIGHDVQVGDFSTLSSSVILAGYVKIGEEVFFGTGANILPKVKIGNRATIGAGAIIMRSVADDTVMYSNPAKKL
jgi:sugar O-acyltransferase (sialic acid O-acetyltransferase NeuD family)